MGWVERAGWRAITLDQGGRGDRAWVPDGAYASPDVAAAPPRTGVKPVAIGASLGGLASLLALGTDGDPAFAGLVLACSPTRPSAFSRRVF